MVLSIKPWRTKVKRGGNWCSNQPTNRPRLWKSHIHKCHLMALNFGKFQVFSFWMILMSKRLDFSSASSASPERKIQTSGDPCHSFCFKGVPVRITMVTVSLSPRCHCSPEFLHLLILFFGAAMSKFGNWDLSVEEKPLSDLWWPVLEVDSSCHESKWPKQVLFMFQVCILSRHRVRFSPRSIKSLPRKWNHNTGQSAAKGHAECQRTSQSKPGRQCLEVLQNEHRTIYVSWETCIIFLWYKSMQYTYHEPFSDIWITFHLSVPCKLCKLPAFTCLMLYKHFFVRAQVVDKCV